MKQNSVVIVTVVVEHMLLHMLDYYFHTVTMITCTHVY